MLQISPREDYLYSIDQFKFSPSETQNDHLWSHFYGSPGRQILLTAQWYYDNTVFTKPFDCLQNHFEGDCDIINLYRRDNNTFDIVDNKYKLYFPNLMRNNGDVEENEHAHCDF